MKAGSICVWIVAVVLLVTADGCMKKEKATPSGGGKGGTFVVTVTPVHHGEYVDTCTIYIKYNTRDAPSNGIYDDSVVCAVVNSIPVAVFTGLKKGDYYLFGRGYHTLYVPPYVKGGLPCTISDQDTVKIFLPTYSY